MEIANKPEDNHNSLCDSDKKYNPDEHSPEQQKINDELFEAFNGESK